MAYPAIKIDTLKIARELEESGIPKAQAEAQTRAYVKLVNMAIEEKLATKHDLHDLEDRVSKKFDKVDEKFDQVNTRLSNV